MSNESIKATGRRKFLQTTGTALAATAIGAPMVLTSRKALAAGNLVVVSWGGNYRTAVEEALAKPFEKEFGVKVTLIDTPDLAKVKAQVMTRNVEWDVFDAVGPMAMTGSKNGYWEPLDPALFDRSDLIAPMTKEAVPFYGFTGGICWDEKKHPGDTHPQTFADYFDVKKFPGQRTLRNRASETLEIALLADGVPPEKIYPLDVERAFRALNRIKPYIGKWVDQTPQTTTLVETGQVDYSYTYATRAKAAQEGGKPIGFSFKQNLIGLEYLVVLKNAPNKQNAMRYVQFALRPDRQAALMNLHGNTPASKKALPLMKPEVRKWLSDPNNKMNLISNDAWWAEHYDELTLRFKEWVLS
ncbi:ABC transporter substrate-binding protein [Chitinasiproducens palmae]|uniref:Putative spermidine/putrescine transport system substrate-binding protein n=1 Tax=Chitinasiproducens palmae TaxID=1770053 RepID=A0A1H2PU67_9BURK|nr:ABC transporter substrate-binding protein [Chitinasiproducens palmae]SDV50712.1 putative spermidine/putrescine transport system substrate-binding protein [Chitinasiproducens palmae]